MRLEDFRPRCEAVRKETQIEIPRYPLVDFHTHMGKLLLGENYAEKYDTAEYVKELRKNGVVKAVNLDGFYGHHIDDMKKKQGEFTDFFINFMWIPLEDYDEPDFGQKTERLIRESYRKGCRGIKLWKDISLYLRDREGKAIRTDDKRFDVIYDTAAELEIPVMMHIGDPVAFFKPKTSENERWEELNACPEWEFSDPDRYMSFQELIDMQEDTVRNHPNTKFVIAHVGSYAENLGWVGEQMEKYPNMYIDIAARIAEIGRVPYSARRFFEKYQNRIVFGTDSTPLTLGYHKIYYRLMETDDEYFPYHLDCEGPGQGRWEIYGLYLEDDILRKVYYKNACSLLNIDVGKFEEEFCG